MSVAYCETNEKIEALGREIVALFKAHLAAVPKTTPPRIFFRDFFWRLNAGFLEEYSGFDLGDICDVARDTQLVINREGDDGSLAVEMARVRPIAMAPYIPAVAGAIYQSLTEDCGVKNGIAEAFVKMSLNEAALNVELAADGISLDEDDFEEFLPESGTDKAPAKGGQGE